MKLKTGDRIKFLNETGGGTILSFLPKNRILIRTYDGFDIPVSLSEVISDPGNLIHDEKVQSDSENKAVKDTGRFQPVVQPDAEEFALNTDEELIFAIQPKPGDTELHVYLVNNSSYNIHYIITDRGKEETKLFDQGHMNARTQMKIKKFIPSVLNEIIRFEVQVIFYKEEFYLPKDPVSVAFFVNPSEVYSGKVLTESDFFEEKILVFTIADFKRKTGFLAQVGTDLSSVVNAKSMKEPEPARGKKVKSKQQDAIEEVDLHIEAITENFSGLSNSEILDLQMARFKITLDTAIIHKAHRIVFIHGVGNGKLRYTLRKELDEKYPDLKYQDASFREYGYGATMVIIP